MGIVPGYLLFVSNAAVNILGVRTSCSTLGMSPEEGTHPVQGPASRHRYSALAGSANVVSAVVLQMHLPARCR